jgi:hypothetical protein
MIRANLKGMAGHVLISLALFIAALSLLTIVSRHTAVAASEQRAMQAARGMGSWVQRIRREGHSALAQPARDAALGASQASAQLPAFVSGWVSMTGRLRAIGEPVALRSGWLLFSALSAPLLYALIAPWWGRRTGLFAAAVLVFVPRGVHFAALAGSDGAAVTAWLAVACCYLRSLRGGSKGWSLATGVVFGLMLSVAPHVLFILPVLVLHTLWIHRADWKQDAREGQLPVASALAFMAVFGPALLVVGTPWLWHDSSARLRQLLVASLTPSVTPALYSGALVVAPPLPRMYGLSALMLSLPVVSLALFGAGLAWLLRRRVACAADLQSERSQSVGLGALVLIALVFSLGWPAIAPEMLSVYPPHWTIALAFVAALAGLGLEGNVRLIEQRVAGRRKWFQWAMVAGCVLLVLGSACLQSVRNPSTLSAAFSPLSGGATAVIESRSMDAIDAAAAAPLGRAIDALGRASVSIYSPEAGAELWDGLRAAGQMRTSVRVAPRAQEADLVAVAGPAGDSVLRALWARGTPTTLLEAVERDAAVLIALYRVAPR